ncbi:MAG: hypothetical protein HKM24_01725, partial [Gammaproteobacteria bacterium]|nr:hypothetical protein [Gammaproteobacteria bacterium]
YFGLMLKSSVRKNYQQGLLNLKDLAEQAERGRLVVSATRNLDLVHLTTMPSNILFISGQANPASEDIVKIYQVAYERIRGTMARNQITASGAPIGITTAWDPDNDLYVFDAAIPIGDAIIETLPDGMRLRENYSGPVVRATHHGPYELLRDTYDGLQAYIADQGLIVTGNSWEEYVNDPGQVSADELMTYVYFPVIEGS